MPHKKFTLPPELCICRDTNCTIPFGECHCGCRAKTSISTHDYRREIKGKPHIFLFGHHMRHILAIEQPTSSNDRYLPLKGGRIAIVDADDYERFGQFNYGVNNRGYVSRCLPSGKRVLLHREVVNAPRNMAVDHINGDTLDNRKHNLRVCTHTQNSWNHGLSKANTSGVSGVYYFKAGATWRAQISVNRVRIYLGKFKSKGAAIRAREAAVSKYHGEYAPEQERLSISRGAPCLMPPQPNLELQPVAEPLRVALRRSL